MSDLSVMAQQFTGMPTKALIAGPLVAAAEANNQMAVSQLDFMLKTCFESADEKDAEVKQGKIGNVKPIMINMEMTRGVIDGSKSPPDITQAKSVITLPLLTLLPINSLAVDDVNVDFTMEVKSSSSKEKSSSQSSDTNVDASLTVSLFIVDIKASVSHHSSSQSSDKQHYQNSQNSTYNVKVHAGQLPLPPGITSVIQAYSQNITPIEVSAAKNSD